MSLNNKLSSLTAEAGGKYMRWSKPMKLGRYSEVNTTSYAHYLCAMKRGNLVFNMSISAMLGLNHLDTLLRR